MMTFAPLIVPSLLAADFSALKDEVQRVEAGGARWLHLDVMDGHFVGNISFGAAVIGALRPHSNLLFDCHLMTDPADLYIDAVAEAGADSITIHAEQGEDVAGLLTKIRARGKKAGLALSPQTPAETIISVLDLLDLVVVMCVRPGFGGQKFLDPMIPKISAVRKLIGARPIPVEVDGGIGPDTVGPTAQAGATVFVAGTAIFGGGGDAALYGARMAAMADIVGRSIAQP